MCWFHKYPSSPLSPCHLWLHGSRQRKGSRPWNTIIPHQPSTSKPFQDVPSYTQCQNSPRLVVRNISSIIIHHHPSSSIIHPPILQATLPWAQSPIQFAARGPAAAPAPDLPAVRCSAPRRATPPLGLALTRWGGRPKTPEKTGTNSQVYPEK